MIAVVLWLRARLCEVVERVQCLSLLVVMLLRCRAADGWEELCICRVDLARCRVLKPRCNSTAAPSPGGAKLLGPDLTTGEGYQLPKLHDCHETAQTARSPLGLSSKSTIAKPS